MTWQRQRQRQWSVAGCTEAEATGMEPHLRSSLSMEDFQKMLASIETNAKCPVCLDRVRTPTTLCTNGHALCRRCRGQQVACPCCRGPFSRITPVFLDALLEILPAQCRNSSRGCDQVLATDGLTTHELQCSYRLERCRVRGCTWDDQVTELVTHVRTSHPPDRLLAASAVARVPDFIVADDEYSARLVAADGCLFWVHITNNFYKKQMPLFVHWVHRTPDVHASVCQVTVVKEHFSFHYRQPVVFAQTPEQILSSTLAKQFLVTPNSIFPNFISSKYDVEIRFDIQVAKADKAVSEDNQNT